MTNKRPVEAIPEVAEFEKARQELASFKESNPEFFAELDQLVARYNAAFDMAEKAVRAKQVSCGSFVLTGRPSVKWDKQKLYEEMGRDFFLTALGGREVPRMELEMEDSKAEAAMVQKLIPDEVAKAARKVKAAYHKPDKLVMP
jgi:hypothetical protein